MKMELMEGGGETLNILEIEIKRISLKLFSIFDRRVIYEQRASEGQRHVEFIMGRGAVFYKF